MANVYKMSDKKSRAAQGIDRGELEEFPAAPRLELKLPIATDVSEEAEEIVEEIDPEEERQAILAEARDEAETMRKSAYEEGLEQGAEKGREAFTESVAHAAQALSEAGAAMQEARQSFLESLEPQVVELAILIAGRVLEREAETDTELLQRTVRRALEKIADRQELRIQVHPDDVKALREHKIALLEEFDGLQELVVEANAEVTPGGCIVESQLMQVDARLETLLANVLEELRDTDHAGD